MSDLVEFLLARIAEDEEVARDGWPSYSEPVRVLAECEAKRRIVDLAGAAQRSGIPDDWRMEGRIAGWRDATTDVLRLLALPYADHPEYDEAWRP